MVQYALLALVYGFSALLLYIMLAPSAYIGVVYADSQIVPVMAVHHKESRL